MVAMELAASWRPLMKSNSRATTMRPTRSGRETETASIPRRSLDVLDHDAVDLVNHILQAVHHPFEMIKNFGRDPEVESLSGSHGLEHAAAGGVMKIIRLPFDVCNALRQNADPPRIRADRA